ncbi:MAG: hypothetical protein ACE5EK_06830, partial [Nitrospinales bacterium]
VVNLYGAVRTKSRDNSTAQQPKSFALTSVVSTKEEPLPALTFLSQEELKGLSDLILGPAGLIASVAQKSVGSFMDIIEEVDISEDDDSSFGLFIDEVNASPETTGPDEITQTIGLNEAFFHQSGGLQDPAGLNYQEFNDPFDADLLLLCKFTP